MSDTSAAAVLANTRGSEPSCSGELSAAADGGDDERMFGVSGSAARRIGDLDVSFDRVTVASDATSPLLPPPPPLQVLSSSGDGATFAAVGNDPEAHTTSPRIAGIDTATGTRAGASPSLMTSPSAVEAAASRGIAGSDAAGAIEPQSAEPLADAARRLIATRGPYVYELYGVLVHSGTAMGGHYYAYIKDLETQAWMQFNDSTVTAASEAEALAAAGGKTFSSYSYMSSANAYMLMYRQVLLSDHVQLTCSLPPPAAAAAAAAAAPAAAGAAPEAAQPGFVATAGGSPATATAVTTTITMSRRFPVDDEVPDYIRASMAAEESREAAAEAAAAAARDAMHVKVWYEGEARTLTLRRSQTVAEATHSAWLAFGLDGSSAATTAAAAAADALDMPLEGEVDTPPPLVVDEVTGSTALVLVPPVVAVMPPTAPLPLDCVRLRVYLPAHDLPREPLGQLFAAPEQLLPRVTIDSGAGAGAEVCAQDRAAMDNLYAMDDGPASVAATVSSAETAAARLLGDCGVTPWTDLLLESRASSLTPWPQHDSDTLYIDIFVYDADAHSFPTRRSASLTLPNDATLADLGEAVTASVGVPRARQRLMRMPAASVASFSGAYYSAATIVRELRTHASLGLPPLGSADAAAAAAARWASANAAAAALTAAQPRDARGRIIGDSLRLSIDLGLTCSERRRIYVEVVQEVPQFNPFGNGEPAAIAAAGASAQTSEDVPAGDENPAPPTSTLMTAEGNADDDAPQGLAAVSSTQSPAVAAYERAAHAVIWRVRPPGAAAGAVTLSLDLRLSGDALYAELAAVLHLPPRSFVVRAADFRGSGARIVRLGVTAGCLRSMGSLVLGGGASSSSGGGSPLASPREGGILLLEQGTPPAAHEILASLVYRHAPADADQGTDWGLPDAAPAIGGAEAATAGISSDDCTWGGWFYTPLSAAALSTQAELLRLDRERDADMAGAGGAQAGSEAAEAAGAAVAAWPPLHLAEPGEAAARAAVDADVLRPRGLAPGSSHSLLPTLIPVSKQMTAAAVLAAALPGMLRLLGLLGSDADTATAASHPAAPALLARMRLRTLKRGGVPAGICVANETLAGLWASSANSFDLDIGAATLALVVEIVSPKLARSQSATAADTVAAAAATLAQPPITSFANSRRIVYLAWWDRARLRLTRRREMVVSAGERLPALALRLASLPGLAVAAAAAAAAVRDATPMLSPPPSPLQPLPGVQAASAATMASDGLATSVATVRQPTPPSAPSEPLPRLLAALRIARLPADAMMPTTAAAAAALVFTRANSPDSVVAVGGAILDDGMTLILEDGGLPRLPLTAEQKLAAGVVPQRLAPSSSTSESSLTFPPAPPALQLRSGYFSAASSATPYAYSRRETGVRITTKGERTAAAAAAAAEAAVRAASGEEAPLPSVQTASASPLRSGSGADAQQPIARGAAAIAGRPPSPPPTSRLTAPMPLNMPGGGALKRVSMHGHNPLFQPKTTPTNSDAGSVRSARADSLTEPRPGEGMSLFDESEE